MTSLFAAFLFSGAALNAGRAAAEETLQGYRGIESESFRIPTTPPKRAWNPHLQSQSSRRAECPAMFERKIAGFGVLKLGPSCDDGVRSNDF